MKKTAETIYLDVRTESEWTAGHIKGAVHFDIARIMAGELPDVPRDSNLQIYCRSGARAETAKMILEHAGFTNTTNAGGLEDLTDKGLPVE